MSNRTLAVLSVIAFVVAISAGMVWYNNHVMNMAGSISSQIDKASSGDASIRNNMQDHEAMDKVTPKDTDVALKRHDYAAGLIKPKEGQPVKKISLIAKESVLEIKEGLKIPVWTYEGTVPGKEIRVTQGDFVQVTLENQLKEPLTIHWHGYPLLSAMDGVPGLNQDAVQPGESFTYEFSADVAGTYWYHSHQEGAKQVDKGLYGALIVEPENKVKPDRDFTLILDEWQEKPMDEMGSMPGDGHNGGHGDMKMNGQDPLKAEEQMMKESYNIFTVNAKAGNLISPLEVKKGEVVRLRLINAGYRSHGIHIPGQEFKVVSTDGQDIEGAALIKDQVILVAPGERYDVEFVVSSDESFVVDAHDSNLYNDQIKIPVKVTDGNGTFRTEAEGVLHPIFDLAAYGNGGSSQFAINQSFSVDYNVILNTKVDQGLQYTINGKTFGELPALKIKTEDTVKFTFDNRSAVDHPMHLHGHFFQVLSRNGTPLKAVIIKDTLMVKPGEKYIVAFKADNPGNWVQHCHELHHAAAGMMQKIEYTDFKSNYISDPKNTYNKPE